MLFVKHTYLCILARFIVWAALSGSPKSGAATTSELIESLISGNHFQRIGILNLAEKDFFHWVGCPAVHARLEGLWLRVLNQLKTYDFAEIHEDILKGVYQELVDPSDRHDLGEYYTPDWLCEKIVDYLIGKTTKGIPSIIDLTCGSGSFLRAAIHRIQKILLAKFPSATVNWESVLVAILSNVHGIDIHPLAVIITKANYVLAIKDLLVHRRKPVRLPVFLADSLLMPQVEEALLFDRGSMVLSFSGQKYRFPPSFFANPRAYDDAIDLASAAAENLAKEEGSETAQGLEISLAKILREHAGEEEIGISARELFRLSKHLSEKIISKENTIWSYILRNTYKPVFMHQKYDFVIGNPPWLSYRYVSDPAYQRELKQLGVEKYKVAPTKQKLITQMEIATIFFVHATTVYLKKGGSLAFVMPRSVFNSDQHERFRAETFDAECDISEYWDLEGVSPLFNVPSCVVFAKRRKKPEPNTSYSALFVSGKLPMRDLPLAKAAEVLEEKRGRLYLSKMGERTALSRNKIDYAERALHYKDRFFQGATIVPRNFYFIVPPKEHELEAEEFFARTDPEQAKEGKIPYRDIFLEGTVETDFIFRTALAKHILPFHVCELPYILLPVLKEKDGYRLMKAQELRDKGYRGAAEWFSKAEGEWNRHRGNKAESQDLYQWLNYQNKLMKQDPETEHVVLYNTSGMNLSSTLVELRSIEKPFYADAKSYWTSTQTVDEGFYLCSVLNSDIVNQLIKPFQSKGLLGERDIHKKVLELPIPQFDRKDPVHGRLALIGKGCTSAVSKLTQSGSLTGTLAAKRAKVREHLCVEMKEISQLVRKILK
jgi:type I restriction-modification system DNA methylase subunit